MTTGSGTLKIVASQELGKLGAPEGGPVLFQWHWYYNIPAIPQWILLLALVVVPQRNRNKQAWLILLLPISVTLLWLLTLLAGSPSYDSEVVWQFIIALTIAWASVWLLSPWLARRGPKHGVPWAWGVMMAVGLVAYVGYFGLWGESDTTVPLLGFWIVFTLPLIGVMVMTGLCCRGNITFTQLLLWPMLWMPVFSLLCMIPILLILLVMQGGGMFGAMEWLLSLVLAGLFFTAITAGLLYLVNLPVAVLCSFTPCYRERFRALVCRSSAVPPVVQWHRSGVAD